MDKRSILFIVCLSLTLFSVNFFFQQQNAERQRAWNVYQKQLQANKEQVSEHNEESSIFTENGDRENTLAQEDHEINEEYYVLENAYQQLVFSSIGGSIVEINLPVQNETNSDSTVKTIGFDKQIEAQSTHNAFFPLKNYHTPDGIVQPKLGGYYPLLRRSLYDENGKILKDKPAHLYSLNLTSEYPEFAETNYRLVSFDHQQITFESVQRRRKITKTYRLVEGGGGAPYCFELTIDIQGNRKGLWLTSGVPEVEWISNMPAPILKYRITKPKGAEVQKIDLPKDTSVVGSLLPDWVCNSNGFFGIILDPLTTIAPGYRTNKIGGDQLPSRISEIDKYQQKFLSEKMPGYNLSVPLSAAAQTTTFRVYAGPFSEKSLIEVDEYFSDPSTGYTPDYYACKSFHGWFAFISQPFTKVLFFIMQLCHTLTGSWALSIILVTVVLRIFLYPLNNWSMKSMRKMQKITPQIQAIQAKYKKNPQQAQAEILNLYRQEKVNPVSGCLPILIQMPFLIGMFDLLKSTFELRGASFIPGWIDNLSAPDVLFSWGTSFPIIGNELHLLPLMLGGVMFLQQLMNRAKAKNASEMTDQQRQQVAMGNIMSIVFTVMFYNFPSGLNLYWLSSMLLSIGQQWLINKQIDLTPVLLEEQTASGPQFATKKQKR